MSNPTQSTRTSLSSSSVITVQRGSGHISDSIHIRSASPAESALLAARALKASAGHQPHRSLDSNDPAEDKSTDGNLERWSHSTSSSGPDKGGQRGRSGAVKTAMQDDKVRHISNGSPSGSPARAHRGSPTGSPSRFRQPTSAKRLDEYKAGRVDASRRKNGSGTSSRSNTPTLGSGALPKLKLPLGDSLPRNYIKSPLSPPVMRTPTAGLLTPTSATEPIDYFGLGIAVSKDDPQRAADAANRSPVGQSRFSANRSRGPSASQSPSTEKRTSRTKEKREKDKKTMLSKALEKANTAVLLDNAQNFASALDAYNDACRLLEHVMERTSGPEDKAKLDAIRNTYATRIEELTALQQPSLVDGVNKQLPPRPTSNGSDDFAPQLDVLSPVSPLINPSSAGTPPVELPADAIPAAAVQTGRRTRDSFLTDAIREVEGSTATGFLGPLWERSKSPMALLDEDGNAREKLSSPDAPPPLSPNRSLSPVPPPKDDVPVKPAGADAGGEAGSWLNTIDESDSDDASSLHSGKRGSAIRRRDLSSGTAIEATDFDTAFDEAVEAAYEQGYEPDQGDEEQQMMDDIAKDYMDEDFSFNVKSKSSLPRESASSGYTRSTWQSSVGGPDRNTAATSLSTLSEDSGQGGVLPHARHQPQSSTSTVQTTEEVAELPATTFDGTTPGGSQILERRNRLSGQSLKPLTIATTASPSRKRAPSSASRRTDISQKDLDVTPWETQDKVAEVTPWETHDKSAEVTPWETQAGPGDAKPSRMGSLRRQEKDTWGGPSSAVSDSGSSMHGDISSPRSRYLRNQKSSVSLRDTAHGSMTPSENDFPQATPTSATFGHHYTRRNDSTSHLSQRSVTVASSSLPPPLPEAGQQGGYYLFDTTLGRSIAQPMSSSPRTTKDSAIPSPFEPCPDSSLLRPFWLLRSISNTVIHPRGAYITTRLFVPHEAWLTRSIKLKNLEDKIAACDLLTAALGPLNAVNTLDADAVLEELQKFEEVMERVQTMLIKKLGSEVGTGAANNMFKDADKAGLESPPDGSMKDSKNSSKFSWRKLRGKGSVSNTTSMSNPVKGTISESTTMSTVPMTSFNGVEKRSTHRREALRDAVFEGPLKEYMAAAAKLCEAAQILDQIARQVEDPGLKHSSSTLVGLEFSTRHAAEFFGFYVCRFMLGDIGVLVDKYVKRSTEWVLA